MGYAKDEHDEQQAQQEDGMSESVLSKTTGKDISGTPLLQITRKDNGNLNIIECILQIGEDFDKRPKDVSAARWWIVLPEWAAADLLKSELKKVFMRSGGLESMNGWIGMVDRFDIYISHLLPDNALGELFTDKDRIYAGVSSV